MSLTSTNSHIGTFSLYTASLMC